MCLNADQVKDYLRMLPKKDKISFRDRYYFADAKGGINGRSIDPYQSSELCMLSSPLGACAPLPFCVRLGLCLHGSRAVR